ncbi:MAG: FeoB-associated Cys-rich membrane protein [Saccharofermentanales bacterium]
MWATWIVIGIVVLMVAGALLATVRLKKRGVKCIGCPYAHQCARNRQKSDSCEI